MRKLTLEGRIIVFKSLAVSKVTRLLLITQMVQMIFCTKFTKTLFDKEEKRQKLNLVLFATTMKRVLNKCLLKK